MPPSPSHAPALNQAQQLLASLGVDQPPVPITEILEMVGLTWQLITTSNETRQLYGLYDPNEATIYVHQEDSQGRQAAVLAYCLGLELLYGDRLADEPEWRILPRQPFAELYQQDEPYHHTLDFTCQLLLPDELFSQYRQKSYATSKRLAKLFGVPQEMIALKEHHAE